MVSKLLGSEARLTIEHPDGRVYTGIALVTQVTMSAEVQKFREWGSDNYSHIPGVGKWSISAEGIGPLITEQRGDHIVQMHKSRTASEWKCDRCGTVWPHEINRCTACAWYRSVIYE